MATSTELRIEFFSKIALFILIAKQIKGIDLLPFCFYRSPQEQKKQFEEKKSLCDGYKRKSKHQSRRAMDFVIVKDGELIWKRIPEYEDLGKIWKSIEGIWGGDFRKINDPYHFEL